MLVHPWDAAVDPAEAEAFVRAQGFGQLAAAGRGRDVPVVVPTQYAVETSLAFETGVDSGTVVLHLARPNPVWAAIDENPTVLLAVAGDWAFVPAAWKAVGDEDPARGIPTTYYAAVQLTARAEVVDDPGGKVEILRLQQGEVDPGGGWVDPAEHDRQLSGIRGLRLHVTGVRAKFKYGGNVDAEHRLAVAQRLTERQGPGDAAARAHLLRRLDAQA
jgi:transcriptional regulator